MVFLTLTSSLHLVPFAHVCTLVVEAKSTACVRFVTYRKYSFFVTKYFDYSARGRRSSRSIADPAGEEEEEEEVSQDTNTWAKSS